LHDYITYDIPQQNNRVPEQLDPVTAASIHDIASGPVQTLGRSKRKRTTTRQKQLDGVNDSSFNDCLCGSVVNPVSAGALMCKQVRCETQWVIICNSFNNCGVIFSFIFSSIIYNVFRLSKPHNIGFVRLVRRLECREAGSGHANDVRLLNITIYRNVPD